jgi:hypothetical protein
MNRSIIIAAAAITMAGAASANHLFTTSSPGAPSFQGAALQLPAGKAPQLGPRARAAEPRTDPAAKLPAAPVERRASLDARQAPVPLQVKTRPALYLPAADISEGYSKGEAGASAKVETTGLGENAARAAIQADGYKAVQALSKGANGVWRAKAMRGTTEVLLTVDSRGRVTTAD